MIIMKRFFYLTIPLLLTFSCNSFNEENDKATILSIMKAQEVAWSNHDIDAFMEGYWKNDSLKFYGASGLTYGWQKTLDNYKKRYPTKNETGNLKFKINSISKISNDSYYVMGEYHLTRPIGNANGVFMIIFKRINGQWKIVADTSC